jgi:hypothetical protein
MRTALRISCAAVITLLVVAAAVGANLQWSAVGGAPVSGGYGEALLGDGASIYLVKCLYATSAPVFYRYSPAVRTWTAETVAGLEIGQFRTGTALAADGAGSIYALCGGRYEDASQKAFLAYDVGAGAWRGLADTPYAQGAGDALAWCGQKKLLYALVGSAHHNGGRSHFLAYDPTKGTWKELAAPWQSTDDGAALAWTGDQYIYALRGEFDETAPHGDFARYDIATGVWQPLPDMPVAAGVGDGGSLLYPGLWDQTQTASLIAFAGNSASEDPGYDVLTYSLTDGEWQSAGRVPCPAGFYVGNRLGYAAGMIYYWQGSPTTEKWICGGKGFYAGRLE